MPDLAEMTHSALETVSDVLDNATDGNPAKVAKDADPKELAAVGIAIAALPVAVEQIAKRVAPKVSDLGEQAKEKVSDTASGVAKDAALSKLKQQGVVGRMISNAASGGVLSKLIPGGSEDGGEGGGLLSKLTPGSSEDDEKDQGGEDGGLLSKLKPGSSDKKDEGKGQAAPGYGGGGRRMPIQQTADIGAPLTVVYNRWTGFEDWPDFMHRLESVEQVDESTVAFSTKIWGIHRRFEAEIIEQRPNERIKWNVTEGVAHTGVVTFHELADRLTRVQVDVDIEPHGMLEKMARGMRFAKRAVRADLHRFKAVVELDEDAEEGWRGTIKDGEVKQRTERRSGGSRSRRRSQSSNGSDPASTGKSRSRSSGSSRSSGASRSSGRSRSSGSSSSTRRSSGSSRSSGGSRSSGRSRSSSSSSRSRSSGNSRRSRSSSSRGQSRSSSSKGRSRSRTKS
jgi:uncharacterized membrane protein